MTFPVVETRNESSLATAGTSHVVTLPTGIAAGDLILILLDKGSTAATFNALAGWTEVVDENLANGITVWVRKADGTEGATVTFTSSASTRSAHTSYRISGAADPAVRLPELSTVATGSSTTPNATTCTPTGGAKDYLWITFFGRGGEEADDDTWVTGTPTNYGTLLQKACGVAGTNLGGMISSAERTNNAASEDAGAFTCATGAWRAYTIAVHPFTPPKTTAPTQVATGTSGYNATTPKSATGFSWVAGDDLYVIGSDADAPNNALGTPTVVNLSGTDLTFAALSGFPIGGASNAEIYVWKATAGGSGSGDIQGTRTSGADDWGIRVWQFRGSDGTGTVATLIDTAKVVSLARAEDHSRIICGMADWSADADVTVTPDPASGGTVRDAVQTGGTGIYTTFTVDWTDQGNAGTTSYGVAGASGAGSMAKAAIEILGTVGVGSLPPMPRKSGLVPRGARRAA